MKILTCHSENLDLQPSKSRPTIMRTTLVNNKVLIKISTCYYENDHDHDHDRWSKVLNLSSWKCQPFIIKSRSLLRKSPLFIINCQLIIMKISTVYNKISICYHEYKSHVLAQLAFHNLLKDVWWNFFTKIINDLTGFQILLPKAHFHIFDSWKCCLLIKFHYSAVHYLW